MDNSSENPDQPENPAYQQYLDSESQKTAKNRRKIFIFVGAGVLALSMLAIVLALIFAKKDSGLPPEQSSQAQAVPTACADESCFNENFLQCSAATYQYNEKNASFKYTILANAEIGCTLSVEYLGGSYLPEATGQTLTCDFDNELDFKTASNNAFSYPDDFNCQGALADTFRDLSAAADE